MTTTDAEPGPGHAASGLDDTLATPSGRRSQGRVTLSGVARSELVKLSTIPSAISALIGAVLTIVGVGAFMAVGIIMETPPPGSPAEVATADPLGGSLSGVSYAVFVVAAYGAVVVTSEYTTGTIRASLAAVPRRSLLLVGKTIALAAATLLVTLAGAVTAFAVAAAILSSAEMSISLTQPGVLRAVVGAALYLTGIAVFAAAIGWLLRNTAGSLVVLFLVLFVLPVIGLFLPRDIADVVVPYLPNNAGTAIMQTAPNALLPPWTGLAVFWAYAAITLTGAGLLLRHRDA